MNQNALSSGYQPIVLGSGVSFSRWISNHLLALVHKRYLRLLFHDTAMILLAICPMEPESTVENELKFGGLCASYEYAAVKWIDGEILAIILGINMTNKEIWPKKIINMTSKQNFDLVSNVREEGATTSWKTAVKNLLLTRSKSTANNCHSEFTQNLLDVNSAAETMMPNKSESSKDALRNVFEVNP